MTNLATVLKEEIDRIARKAVRQQTAETTKATARCERDIAALKRQIEDLRRRLSPARTTAARERTASGKTATKKPDGKARGAASAPGKRSSRTRFSPQGLKTERERLGMSAENYGRLVGVSGLSIYNWEQEKARPRESSVTALMSIKGIGKREAAKRLAALTNAKPKPKAKSKAKPKAKTEAKEPRSVNGGKVEGEDAAAS